MPVEASMVGRSMLGALAFLLLVVAAPRSAGEDVCPYCGNDPELLAAAGLVSHGPIDIGFEGGSEGLREELAMSEWVFLESEHLRWASSLGDENLGTRDRERMQGDLEALRAHFPEVPDKPRKLDPWLRVHLMALRGERFYARFQELLGVTDDDFPEERGSGPYMGAGPYLGEKDKFEVVLHVNRGTHHLFTGDNMGVKVTDSLRWHVRGQHKMLASIPAVDADLRQDAYLYPHLVHNLSHLLLCAYKHFSYDPPIWLDEGLAHAMEQEIDPEFHSLDGDEGTKPDHAGPGDWGKELAKLERRGDVTPFAELMRIGEFGEMSLDDHVSAWGAVRFLLDAHPERFAAFVGAVKGQLDEAGYPDGSDLRGLQRTQLRELWDWSPAQLDEAFHAWIEDR